MNILLFPWQRAGRECLSDSLFGKAGITKCGFSGGLQRSERVL